MGHIHYSIPARLADALLVLRRTIFIRHLDRTSSLLCAYEEVQYGCEAMHI
jgi:hypothetical protein